MGVQEIKKVKKGEFIQVLKKDGTPQKKVWQLDGYCRINKKYELTSVEDINDFKYLKGDKMVVTTDY